MTLLLPLAACTAAGTLSAQRTPAATIGGGGSQTKVAMATDGVDSYVVWTDYVHAWLRRELAGGIWSAPTAVDRSASIYASSPSVALGNGTVFAVWEGSSNMGPFGPVDSQIRFNRSTDGGATWRQNDVMLTAFPPGNAYRPQLAVDGSHVFVTWEDRRDGPTNVYFQRSLDGGQTWLPVARRLDTDAPAAADSSRPRIVANGSTVCVVWMDGRHGGYAPYCNRSLDNGTTWLANDLRLSTVPIAANRWSREPEIAADGLSVCVVWRDGRHWTTSNDTDGDIYGNRSLDGGTTWLPLDVRVGPGATPGVTRCLETQVAQVGSTVHACWRIQSGTFQWDIYTKRSLDGGATWLPTETRLNGANAPGTVFTMLPIVAATPEVVTVAWQGLQGLYCNRSTDGGVTWIGSQIRLTGGGAAYHTLVAAGNVVRAAWIEGASIFANLPFGFVRYGAAMPGSGGIAPVLRGTGVPTIANSFSVTIANGLGGAPGLLAVGAGPASRVSTPMFGGIASVNPFLSVFAILGGTGPGAGTWSTTIAVPNDPGFVGFDLNFQALLLDAASPSGVVLTNAIETWID